MDEETYGDAGELLPTKRAAVHVVMTALSVGVGAAAKLIVSQRTACHVVWASGE